MCKLFWAADSFMSTVEFEDIVSTIKHNIYGIKLNSLYHHFQHHYPYYLALEYHRYVKLPLFLDLKLYDTPRTIENTIMSLPNFDYITVTFAYDNFMTINAAIEAVEKRGSACFIVFGLTTSKPVSESYILSKMKYLLSRYNNIGFVIPGNMLHLIPVIKELNNSVITLTPGIKPITSISYGDQLITTTLEEVDKYGGDFSVVGRSVTSIIE